MLKENHLSIRDSHYLKIDFSRYPAAYTTHYAFCIKIRKR